MDAAPPAARATNRAANAYERRCPINTHPHDAPHNADTDDDAHPHAAALRITYQPRYRANGTLSHADRRTEHANGDIVLDIVSAAAYTRLNGEPDVDYETDRDPILHPERWADLP